MSKVDKWKKKEDGARVKEGFWRCASCAFSISSEATATVNVPAKRGNIYRGHPRFRRRSVISGCKEGAEKQLKEVEEIFASGI